MKQNTPLAPGAEIMAKLSKTRKPHLWYESLNRICKELSQIHNVPLATIAGILVTFSAQKVFSENLTQTLQFLCGLPIQGMYSKTQLNNCQRILSGEDPLSVWAKESYKYRNFYASILLQDGAVCVDSHIINHYLEKHPHSRLHKLDRKRIFESKRYYQTIQDYVRKFAAEMGMKSYQAQAHLWVIQRGQMF